MVCNGLVQKAIGEYWAHTAGTSSGPDGLGRFKRK